MFGRESCAALQSKEAPQFNAGLSVAVKRLGGSLLFELAQPQPEARQLLLDLVQARLAEVLAPQELVLGAAGELAQAVDVQTLKRLAAADRQLQVRHRLAQ